MKMYRTCGALATFAVVATLSGMPLAPAGASPGPRNGQPCSFAQHGTYSPDHTLFCPDSLKWVRTEPARPGDRCARPGELALLAQSDGTLACRTTPAGPRWRF